jgi:hypothetical protein
MVAQPSQVLTLGELPSTQSGMQQQPSTQFYSPPVTAHLGSDPFLQSSNSVGTQNGQLQNAMSSMHMGQVQSGPFQSGMGPTASGVGPFAPSGPYQNNGPTGMTIVPSGDGASMVNAPEFGKQSQYQQQSSYGNLSAQDRQSANWHHDDAYPNLLQNGAPSYAALQYTGQSNQESLAAQQFLGGMEGHTRLLQLMHEAFSTAQNQAFEPMKPKGNRWFKSFGILDEVAMYCGFSDRSPQEWKSMA